MGAVAATRRNEPAVARRHVVLALALLLAGTVQLAAEPVTAAALQRTFPLLVFGGLVILLIGTSRMLATGMLGLRLPQDAAATWAPAILVAVAAVGLHALGPGHVATWLAIAWAAGLLMHIVTLARSLAPATRGTPLAKDLPVAATLIAAVLYAAAAVLLVPLGAAGRVAAPIVVHIVLAGAITLAIVAVGTGLLPRFSGRGRRSPWRWLAGPVLIPGPALLAHGLWDPASGALLPGALFTTAGLGVFAVQLAMHGLAARRVRAASLAYAAAAFSLMGGLALGLAFAFDPAWRRHAPLHGTLNLLGFIGLLVIGAIGDLYAPAGRAGAVWARRQAWTVVTLAVLGVAGFAVSWWQGIRWGHVWLSPVAAAFALQLAGTVAAERRAIATARQSDPGPG